MKKNILFIMNNLTCGGAEKALISLLETIDYSKYNVDLFLFKHEGLFFNKIPQQVNLLEEPINYKYFDMSIKNAVFDCLRKGEFDKAILRIKAGYFFKFEKNKPIIGQKVWKYISKSIKQLEKEYDVAIGYLEGYPIYFCIDNTNAKKKIGFIHTQYDQLGMDPLIDKIYFNKLNKIVTVSDECANVLRVNFPFYKEKIKVMLNIVSPRIINKMSLENLDIKFKGILITSVGRLLHLKGFDMAIKACEILVKNGYEIKWYIVGEGKERPQLEKMIRERNLEEIFILVGQMENPYPFIKRSNIYVQPSRYEGKSIAIDEAKILNKPIIVTNFTTAKDQINHGETGLIVEMKGEAIAEGIQRIIDDKELRSKLTNNLSKEILGTESEIAKFYDLINTD